MVFWFLKEVLHPLKLLLVLLPSSNSLSLQPILAMSSQWCWDSLKDVSLKQSTQFWVRSVDFHTFSLRSASLEWVDHPLLYLSLLFPYGPETGFSFSWSILPPPLPPFIWVHGMRPSIVMIFLCLLWHYFHALLSQHTWIVSLIEWDPFAASALTINTADVPGLCSTGVGAADISLVVEENYKSPK